MAIWVIKDGQREGPYEEQDVRELVYEGTYTDAEPAIRDGQYDWSTLGQILGRVNPAAESPARQAETLAPPETQSPPPVPQADPPPIPAVAGPPTAQELPSASPRPRQVSVVDFQMPFWSMVIFMVKWVIAAIPALMILGLILSVFWVACLALVAAVMHR